MKKKCLAAIILMALLPNISFADLNYGTAEDETNDKFKSGVDYEIIKPAIEESNDGENINVINFFSYGCQECVSPTEQLEEWKKTMPYYARMNNSPIVTSIQKSYPARIYFTLEKLNRTDLNIPFLEESSNGKTDFSNFDVLTSWFSGRGIKTDDFKKNFDSNYVIGKIYSSPSIISTYSIDSIPLIVIAGKYKITAEEITKHKNDLKDVVNFLVDKAKNGDQSNNTNNDSVELN